MHMHKITHECHESDNNIYQLAYVSWHLSTDSSSYLNESFCSEICRYFIIEIVKGWIIL